MYKYGAYDRSRSQATLAPKRARSREGVGRRDALLSPKHNRARNPHALTDLRTRCVASHATSTVKKVRSWKMNIYALGDNPYIGLVIHRLDECVRKMSTQI